MNKIDMLETKINFLEQEYRELKARLHRMPGGHRPPDAPIHRPSIDFETSASLHKREPVPPPPPDSPQRDARGEAIRVRRREAHEARIAALYSDRARTRQVARDLDNLIGGAGLVVALTEDAAFCQSVVRKLQRGVTSAVLTEDTPDDYQDGILSRIEDGDVQVVVMTIQMFGRELFDSKQIDTLYLASPVSPNESLLGVLYRWLRLQPSKAVVLKLLGRPDTGISNLRSAVQGRLRDCR